MTTSDCSFSFNPSQANLPNVVRKKIENPSFHFVFCCRKWLTLQKHGSEIMSRLNSSDENNVKKIETMTHEQNEACKVFVIQFTIGLSTRCNIHSVNSDSCLLCKPQQSARSAEMTTAHPFLVAKQPANREASANQMQMTINNGIPTSWEN